jgi:hypothetical protein
MCVSDRPTDPNICYAPKNNRSSKSGINTGSKHRSNVQGNEEKPVFNKSVSTKR